MPLTLTVRSDFSMIQTVSLNLHGYQKYYYSSTAATGKPRRTPFEAMKTMATSTAANKSSRCLTTTTSTCKASSHGQESIASKSGTNGIDPLSFPIGTFYEKSLPGILVLPQILPSSTPSTPTMIIISTSTLRIVAPTWIRPQQHQLCRKPTLAASTTQVLPPQHSYEKTLPGILSSFQLLPSMITLTMITNNTSTRHSHSFRMRTR